jgi:hypothetical protein
MWLILFQKIWPFLLRRQGIWVGILPFNFWQLCKDIWLDTWYPPNTRSRFLCIFSLPAWRNLFSASGKVPAMLYWVFWPAEGTSHPLTVSKSQKPQLCFTLRRRRTWVQALPWFEICAQIFSPSPIQKQFHPVNIPQNVVHRVLKSLSCSTHVSEQVNTW